MIAAAVLAAAGCLSFTAFAEEDISYSQVASEDEKATAQEVGIEGMFPVYGRDIEDGTYEVAVECSSSMFRVERAVLTVSGGEMTADLTLSGTGYLKLYMGTGEEAAASDGSDYIDFREDADGKYVYTIPVEALDEPVDCAAFSKKKEKWYDRTLLFEVASLPADAVLVELPDYEALKKAEKEERIAAMKAEQEEADAENAAGRILSDREPGIYLAEVELNGGTGRSYIVSPAELTIREDGVFARIEWSSSNYDYMVVEGETYLPVNQEGNSVFEIPVTVMDEAMPVTADTTAMSTPHEIEYTLTFRSDTLTPADNKDEADTQGTAIAVLAGAAVCVILSAVIRRKRNFAG